MAKRQAGGIEQLAQGTWDGRLEALAVKASNLGAAEADGQHDLQARADLGAELFGLLWISLSDPAWIEATCRLAVALGEPVLAAPDLPALLEAQRRLRLATISKVSRVAPVELPEPELPWEEEPEPAPAPAAEPEPEPEELPEPEPEPVEVLEPEPADPIPAEPEPEPEPAPLCPVEPEPEELPEPEPEPEPEQHDPVVAEWVSAPQLAEILGISLPTVKSWIVRAIAVEGVHYRPGPTRAHEWNVEACRSLAAERSRSYRSAHGITAEKTRRLTGGGLATGPMREQPPEGWMTITRAAGELGSSSSSIHSWVSSGLLVEGTHYRSAGQPNRYWYCPAAIRERLAERDQERRRQQEERRNEIEQQKLKRASQREELRLAKQQEQLAPLLEALISAIKSG